MRGSTWSPSTRTLSAEGAFAFAGVDVVAGAALRRVAGACRGRAMSADLLPAHSASRSDAAPGLVAWLAAVSPWSPLPTGRGCGVAVHLAVLSS